MSSCNFTGGIAEARQLNQDLLNGYFRGDLDDASTRRPLYGLDEPIL